MECKIPFPNVKICKKECKEYEKKKPIQGSYMMGSQLGTGFLDAGYL